MPTIGDVINRLYRDYLTPPDEQPAQTTLASAITESAQALRVTDNVLTQEEEDSVGAGTLLEMGQELDRVLSVAWPVVNVQRGVLGTSAAVIDRPVGEPVIVRPKYPRIGVFGALGDAIVALWPTLARVCSEAYNTGSGSFIEVAADVEEVLGFTYPRYEAGSSITAYDEGAVELLPYPFPPALSTQRAIQLTWVPYSRTGYLRYLARFIRPTSESQTFAELGLDEEWMTMVCYGALLRLIAPSDLSARQVQYITRGLEIQGYPVGSGKTVAQTLVQVYEYLLGQARRAFQAAHPIRQTWTVL